MGRILGRLFEWGTLQVEQMADQTGNPENPWMKGRAMVARAMLSRSMNVWSRP